MGTLRNARACSSRVLFVLFCGVLTQLASTLSAISQTSSQFKFGWFYRMVVELSYENKPLNIEVIIACASQSRQILGEGRSAQAIWAPYIYGVSTHDGHGVLVQSPNVCSRDLTKNPVPADFMPLVLWAPDAKNLEFLIAYVHEKAFEQSAAKLKFVRASITEVTEADHKKWRATEWKENIVPLGDVVADQQRGVSFFRGEGFFPEGDARNQSLLRMACSSYIRMPIPEQFRTRVSKQWPAGHPSLWLIDRAEARSLIYEHKVEFTKEGQVRGLWERDSPTEVPTFSSGKGIKRARGVGNIETSSRAVVSGEALRIPFRVETGYPWAKPGLSEQSAIDVQIDTEGGADQGFAYCYRDVYQAYFYDRRARKVTKALNQRFFVDSKLVGEWPSVLGQAPYPALVERDEYIWAHTSFPLTHELARMQ